MRKAKSNQKAINDNFYKIEDYYKDDNKSYMPPKNSLSELVFNNNLDLLESALKVENRFVDERDDTGETTSWTPLYWAVKYRHVECVKLLLSYGATVNTVINDMEECSGTVLDLVTLRGDSEIEDVLREYIERDNVNTTNSPFKAIRTKLRGKAPAFNFAYYGKKKA